MRCLVCSATPGWPFSAKLAEATETPASLATSRIPPGCCGPPLLPAMMFPASVFCLAAPDEARSRTRKPPTALVPVTWRRDKHAARARERPPRPSWVIRLDQADLVLGEAAGPPRRNIPAITALPVRRAAPHRHPDEPAPFGGYG